MTNQGRITVETSQNGHPVPIIKNVYLHSIIDPIEEAALEMKQFEDKILSNSNLLILGLGFGYHIDECERILRRYNTKYRIFVVEPNEELIEKFQSTRKCNHLEIFHSHNAHELYDNFEYINFLLKKPIIIPHKPSLKVNSYFFTELLKFRSNDMIKTDNLSSELKDFLGDDYSTGDFFELINKASESLELTNAELFLLASIHLASIESKRVSL
jgi:hypothetical protein